MSRGGVVALKVVDSGVIERVIDSFEVLALVGDDVVVGDSAGVNAPAHIDSNFGVAFLTGFGSNDNYTVGTAGTVESGGRSVFKDGERSDVAVRYSSDVAVVGHTVDNVKRSDAGVDRADATDEYCSRSTGLAVRADGLHTYDFTREGVGDVGGKSVFELVSFNDRCRTGVRAFGSGTVGNHDSFFEKLGVRFEGNRNITGSGNGASLGMVTNHCNLDSLYVSTDRETEFTILISGNAGNTVARCD